MKTVPEPKTLQEAIVTFADPDNALWDMVAKRWPNGVVCPTCGREDVNFLAAQRRWQRKSKHPLASLLQRSVLSLRTPRFHCRSGCQPSG